MKIFGGSGGRKPTTQQKRAETKQKQQPANSTQGAKTAPKPTGKVGSGAKKASGKAGKRKHVVIIAIVLVLVALIGVGAAAAFILVRPPEVQTSAKKSNQNKNDVDIDSLLNSGTRIGDRFTFLVGAVDEDETRTDALMVATMDTKEKSLNIMNIPRDTMCNNGARGASRKINAAYSMSKGIEQTKKEIERLMGFVPDNYVIVNFDGIAAIVDAIGGIEYEIPFVMQYDDPSQNLHIDLMPGKQKLTGKQTVEFLRWRHNNDYSVQYPNGDEGRVENQQKFLKALAKEVFQLKNAPNIKKIADAVMNNVKTDFTAGELVWMGMQAMKMSNENISFHTLPGYGQMSTAGTWQAYSFFFPYYNQTLELVNKYFNPYEEPITTLDMVGGPEGSGGGGGGGGSSSGSDDNYVWGDTSAGNSNDEGGGDSGETQTNDPEAGGNTSGGGETSGGSTSGGSTSGGSTSGGETSGGSTSGGETSGGTTSGGGETSGGNTSGGGETSGGASGGETSGGGTSGGGETSGGGTSGGGETTAPIDPEA